MSSVPFGELPPEHERWDVVVVGAGVAGALVARCLGDAGLRVLVLEAGEEEPATETGYRRLVDRMHQALYKTPDAPFAPNRQAPSPAVLDRIGWRSHGGAGHYAQRGALPFSSTYTRAVGGSTLHWLGSCPRMRPADFELRARYGRGVDWPFGYDTLEPYYRKAERELGVSGDAATQRALGMPSPEGYVYPMLPLPPSYLDGLLARATEGLIVPLAGEPYPVRITSTPQARNSTPDARYDGAWGPRPVGSPEEPYLGERCGGSAACVPLCPLQARYSALRTLRTLSRERVRVVPRAVATRLLLEPDSGHLRGVLVRRYAAAGELTSTEHTVRARAYVVAANAVESAVLLLASGAGNSSGLVGRGLMDHPFVLSWGLAREHVGPFRGPSSTSGIETLCDGPFRATHAALRVELGNWGWDMLTGAPLGEVDAAVDAGLWGAPLREHLRRTVTRQVRLGALLEQLPEDRNRVEVDPSVRDDAGNLRPVLRWDLDAYTREGALAARRVHSAIFRAAGIEEHTHEDPSAAGYVEHQGQHFSFFGGGHLGGTHRMGTQRRHSVTDEYQRSWDHENLFLVGAGSMPTMGAANPTLTLAALALRTAERLAKELRP